MNSLLRIAFGIGILFLVPGCDGDSKVAKVSGVVTLDGNPYPNAIVTFQPVGDKGNPNPGRGSSGLTDNDGRFVLKIDGEMEGAIIGKHLVRITTQYGGNSIPKNVNNVVPSEDGLLPVSPKSKVYGNQIDPIPSRYNESSKLEFVVPSGGTDQANFDLESNKKQKNKK